MPRGADTRLAHAWSDLGGPADALARVTLDGPETVLASRLDTTPLLQAASGAAANLATTASSNGP